MKPFHVASFGRGVDAFHRLLNIASKMGRGGTRPNRVQRFGVCSFSDVWSLELRAFPLRL